MSMQISQMNSGEEKGRNVFPSRLVHAAQEFEGQMLKELLRPIADGFESESGPSCGILGEFASEALGRALSQQGGFGIADRVISEISRTGKLS